MIRERNIFSEDPGELSLADCDFSRLVRGPPCLLTRLIPNCEWCNALAGRLCKPSALVPRRRRTSLFPKVEQKPFGNVGPVAQIFSDRKEQPQSAAGSGRDRSTGASAKLL